MLSDGDTDSPLSNCERRWFRFIFMLFTALQLIQDTKVASESSILEEAPVKSQTSHILS